MNASASISSDRMLAAMLAADPALAARRKMANMENPTKAWLEELSSFEGAARTRVRRVIAALNGIDIEKEAAPWTEPPAIITRATVNELCSALCDDAAYAAVERALGAARAAALMGVITAF